MEEIRNMPIGIQDFDIIRTSSSYVYVDKTQFIPCLEVVGRAHFLARPRRFGKSLFLSMLQAYFEGRKELFKGLFIEKFKAKRGEEWKTYPVLKLDLNAKNYTEKERLKTILNDHIRLWEGKYDVKTNCTDVDSAFADIIRLVCKKHNSRVVILIDEYDKPLLEAIGNEELQEQYRAILKGFYSVIKSLNGCIHLSFLTGVTKFSKVSIFSGLNNLDDISYDAEYSSICGISEQELQANFAPEIEALANKQAVSVNEMTEILRKKYDGYRFSEKEERMYNPFSLCSAFSKKKLSNYWFETATPNFLVYVLEQTAFKLPDLENNITVSMQGMDDYRVNYANLAPLLFQTGYLTIKDYDEEFFSYRLGFPNDEVRYAFLKRLMNIYNGAKYGISQEFAIGEFVNSMKQGDIERVLTLIKALMASIPYDSFPEGEQFLREHNYQTAVYLIFHLMGQYVRTEVHGSVGRSDVEVETSNAIYIFEFKVGGKPVDAIAQIKKQGYANKYASSNKSIFLIGAIINRNKRTLGKWKIEKLDFKKSL